MTDTQPAGTVDTIGPNDEVWYAEGPLTLCVADPLKDDGQGRLTIGHKKPLKLDGTDLALGYEELLFLDGDKLAVRSPEHWTCYTESDPAQPHPVNGWVVSTGYDDSWLNKASDICSADLGTRPYARTILVNGHLTLVTIPGDWSGSFWKHYAGDLVIRVEGSPQPAARAFFDNISDNRGESTDVGMAFHLPAGVAGKAVMTMMLTDPTDFTPFLRIANRNTNGDTRTSYMDVVAFPTVNDLQDVGSTPVASKLALGPVTGPAQ